MSKRAILSLYRSVWRTGRRWTDKEEQAYIFAEARAQFRAHQNAHEREIDDLLTLGQQRLEYAEHYGIPYPRQHHANQFYKRQYLDPPRGSAEGDLTSAGSPEVSGKLAAALARRRKKQEGK